MTLPKLGYFTVKRKLEALARRGFANLSIEEIGVLMRQALTGHADGARSFDPGPHLYRARNMGGLPKPERRADVTYPPAGCVTALGRCNRIGEQIFYGSNGIIAALLEIKAEGQPVALSRWRLVDKVWLTRAGYSEKTFQALSSQRTVAGDVDTGPTTTVWRSKVQRLINDFASDQFTTVDSQGAGTAYNISIALFDIMVRSTIMDKGVVSSLRIDGLNYPSVAFQANTTNIALLPASADRALKLVNCDMVVMEAAGHDEIRLRYEDHATAGPDEVLSWTGQPPAWCGSSNSIVIVKRGERDWRAFGEDGAELNAE